MNGSLCPESDHARPCAAGRFEERIELGNLELLKLRVLPHEERASSRNLDVVVRSRVGRGDSDRKLGSILLGVNMHALSLQLSNEVFEGGSSEHLEHLLRHRVPIPKHQP